MRRTGASPLKALPALPYRFLAHRVLRFVAAPRQMYLDSEGRCKTLFFLMPWSSWVAMWPRESRKQGREVVRGFRQPTSQLKKGEEWSLLPLVLDWRFRLVFLVKAILKHLIEGGHLPSASGSPGIRGARNSGLFG